LGGNLLIDSASTCGYKIFYYPILGKPGKQERPSGTSRQGVSRKPRFWSLGHLDYGSTLANDLVEPGEEKSHSLNYFLPVIAAILGDLGDEGEVYFPIRHLDGTLGVLVSLIIQSLREVLYRLDAWIDSDVPLGTGEVDDVLTECRHAPVDALFFVREHSFYRLVDGNEVFLLLVFVLIDVFTDDGFHIYTFLSLVLC